MGSKRKWEVPSRHTVWEFDEDAPVGAEAEAILSEGGAEEIAGELLEAGEERCGPASSQPTLPKWPGRSTGRRGKSSTSRAASFFSGG